MVELRARTVTLFFADIERSTTLAHLLGDEYGDVLDDFRGLLRGAASEAGGREVDSRADEFFAAFPSASDGISAAIEAQRRFASHDWPGGLRVRVRIGLHTGEPAIRDGAYLGVAVHFAARVCAAGHGGQVLVSQATHHLCGADVATRELGLYELAGMPQPARLFQVVAPGLRTSFPPLRAAAARRKLRFRLPERRSRRPVSIEETSWRIQGMLPDVEPESRAALIGLGSALRVADRASNGAAELLERVDHTRLERRRAALRQDAIRSQRAQLRLDSVQSLLARVQELADRRRHLLELVTDLALEIDTPPSVEAAGIHSERISAATRDLDTAFADAIRVLDPRTFKRKRTLRRGVYRLGSKYVVTYYDETGTESQVEFETGRDARAFYQGVRIAEQAKAEYTGPPTKGGEWSVGGGGT